MGAFYTSCCHTDEKEEQSTILCSQSWSKASVSSESEVFVSELGQEWKLWRLPHTSTSITEEESDQELQNFIMMRNQVDKDTEEWEKLNYDIHALKYARREVCVRWKKILLLLGKSTFTSLHLSLLPCICATLATPFLALGYQREVDSLLAVNKQSVMSDGENLERARELLYTVCEESSLFPSGTEPNDRFLLVMDRLVSLDSAEDFVRLAKEKYPQTKLWE